jgi:general secretion pathway protein L
MSLRPLSDAFVSWMTSVAEAIIAAVDRNRSPRCVRLVEEDVDVFRVEGEREPETAAPACVRIHDGRIVEPPTASLAVMLKGSRIELMLKSERFLFRPLELPKRAGEFLDGIVRAQIDRLTPWMAGDAAFGWTVPRETEKDRIGLTVGATARALIMPVVQAFAPLGAKILVVSTLASASDPRTAEITVLEHRVVGSFDVRRMRRGLVVLFVAAGLSAVVASICGQWIGADLDVQHGDLSRRISARRVAMRQDGSGVEPGRQLLERRKQGTAASVMVLEALSKVLPDHTYVTELRMEGDKLQLVGMTQDAPSLIRLMEQSPHFARATFFAPTTRSPGDSGERFHIEARLKPVFTSS